MLPFIQRTPNEYRHKRYLNLQLGARPSSFPSPSFPFLPPSSTLPTFPLPFSSLPLEVGPLLRLVGPGDRFSSPGDQQRSSGALRDMKHQTVGLEPSGNIPVQTNCLDIKMAWKTFCKDVATRVDVGCFALHIFVWALGPPCTSK